MKEEERTNSTENLKQETTNTVNEVRDTIKKVDIKKDSIETKGLIKELLTHPIEKIKEITEGGSKKFLKYAMIILVVWTVAVLIRQCFAYSHWKYMPFLKTTIEIIKVTIVPILSVIILSVIILMRNKGSKKSLTDILTAVTISQIPSAIASVIGLLNIIGAKVAMITSPISGLCSVISIILLYFTIQHLTEEKEDSIAIKNFVIIEAIYYIVYFVFLFLGIYL